MADQTFRDRLEADLERRYSKLLEVIDSGLEATKTVWCTCSKCGKRTEVETH